MTRPVPPPRRPSTRWLWTIASSRTTARQRPSGRTVPANPLPSKRRNASRFRPLDSLEGILGRRSRRVVGEGHVVGQEHKRELAGRAVPLLGDEDVGDALPLGIPIVELLAVQEDDDVGVLLDGARIAQIGELRLPLV